MKNKLGIIAVLVLAVALFLPNIVQAGGGPIYVLTGDMPDAKVGTIYSSTIDFNNDNGSSVSVFISNLPPGISLYGSGYNNAAIGGPAGTYSIPLSGTPTAAGSYAMLVSIQEQSGSAGTQAYVYINVNPASTSGCRINSFTANTLTPQIGESSTLSWNTTGCKSAEVVSTNDQGSVFSVPLSTKLSGSVSTGALSAGSAYYRLVASSSNSADPVSAEAQSNIAISVQSELGPPVIPAHPEGTNVLGPDGTVYRIIANARSPYTSAGAFLSYKFNSWAGTVPANDGDMALPIATYTPNGLAFPITYFIPPRNGALINDHGTVYLITGGGRAGFATAAVFTGLGFSFSNVYPGDTSFIGLNYEPINSVNLKHHDGVLINDNGTLYVMQNGYRVGFPNMAVLDSWGYWVTDAVPANSYDRAAAVSGVMQTRMANQLGI